ncbi:MAG: hypothetical protein ACAH95_16065 [Fimbriimonas sp.]
MANLHAYLKDVREGLKQEMPTRQVDAILLETEAHLRERMEALIELGIPAAAAEEEAIASFGDWKSFVQETIDAHRPSRKALDRSMVRAAVLASIVAFVTPFLAIANYNPTLFLLPFPLLIGLTAISFRARRAIPLKMGAVAAGFFLAFWLWCGAYCYSLDYYFGSGFVPRWEVQKTLDAYAQNIPAEAIGKELAERRKLLLNSEDPFTSARASGLTQGDKMLAPVGFSQRPIRITYRPFKVADALDNWRHQGIVLARSLSEMGHHARVGRRALLTAQNAPYLTNLRANFDEAGPIGGIWLVLLAGANLLGAAVGWIRHRLRRIRIVVQVLKS